MFLNIFKCRLPSDQTSLSFRYNETTKEREVIYEQEKKGRCLFYMNKIVLKGAALLHDPEEIRQDLLKRFSCDVEVR